MKVFKREDISEEGFETAEDFGDYLLRIGAVDEEAYAMNMQQSENLLANRV